MARVKSLLYHCLLLFTLTRIIQSNKRRPLVFVLCLKGFRWDLPHYFSSLPHLHQLSRTGSTALWVESEFGGSQTNILSLMSGLHVESHARRDFIETIPVLNEHVGGHTRLFYWPWFEQNSSQSTYSHLLSGRKGQPEIIEPYTTHGRMSLQRLQRAITPMLDSLLDENDRTNLVMAFIDEPFSTLSRHEIYTDSARRIMVSIDRLIGRLLSTTRNNNINLIVLGDHGFEPIDCRQPIHLDNIFNTYMLNEHTHRYSGTSLSFVLYPKTEYGHRLLLSQLQQLPQAQVQIYSKDHDHLPPKLRLPTISGQPSPILLFPKAQYYFAYNKEPNSILCASQSMIDCQRTVVADHSDDPRHLSMRTALLASGPGFKKNHINEPVLITDIYALLRQLLCLSPLPSMQQGFDDIHNMLDFTHVSNECAFLYTSTASMVHSVSTKPTQLAENARDDFQLVRVNISANSPYRNRNLIRMRVRVE